MPNDTGRAIFDELQQKGIELDWRHPNVMRLAPVPLYNTFLEVYRFGELLRRAMR